MSDEQQAGAIDIDPGAVASWLEREPDLQLIDVREDGEYAAGHIAASRHIQLTALAGSAATIDRDRPVVFYCRVGGRSEMAAQALRTAGFEAYSMTGGLLRWAQEDLPLSPSDGRVADH